MNPEEAKVEFLEILYSSALDNIEALKSKNKDKIKIMCQRFMVNKDHTMIMVMADDGLPASCMPGIDLIRFIFTVQQLSTLDEVSKFIVKWTDQIDRLADVWEGRTGASPILHNLQRFTPQEGLPPDYMIEEEEQYVDWFVTSISKKMNRENKGIDALTTFRGI